MSRCSSIGLSLWIAVFFPSSSALAPAAETIPEVSIAPLFFSNKTYGIVANYCSAPSTLRAAQRPPLRAKREMAIIPIVKLYQRHICREYKNFHGIMGLLNQQQSTPGGFPHINADASVRRRDNMTTT
jgi:hypothetical protein